MKLSIRSKFLIVMSGLLLVCLGFYLLMSITVFKSDKIQLVYDLNRSQVNNLSSEINTKISAISDRLSLYMQMPERDRAQLQKNLFSSDMGIVSLQIFDKNQNQALTTHLSSEFLETYGLKKENFSKAINLSDLPIEEISNEGEAIWNSSFEGAPPLIGFGKRILLLDENQVPVKQQILISLIKIDSFLKSVSLVDISEVQISNRHGEILVQSDARKLLQHPSLAEDGIFKKAIESIANTSVFKIQTGDDKWLAAFAKSYGGKLIVTSKVPEFKVFKVVQSLAVRTLLFGSIVMTLVILAAFLLSRSLTKNIAILARRMTTVSEGDLTTNIELKGRDETVQLGQIFNQMITDLKESRDELEVMNRELDQKVKDRTLELEIQNQKVAEAQEALLQTGRLASMGEVAGKAAHEVLNPLTSLLTRAGLTQKRMEANYRQPLELLEEIEGAWDQDYRQGGFEELMKNWQEPSSLDPKKNMFVEDVENLSEIRLSLQKQAAEIAKDIQFIREEGDRIGKIIHGMRRLGNRKSEVKDQNLHMLLSDCCYIMADLFDQQNFEIRKKFDATLDVTRIDRDEFIQAVTNLMRNSLQSMIEARINKKIKNAYLEIRTHSKNGEILIEIEDNGLGISEDNQSKLFDLNFTTKSSDEGTGLGLSISRRFIRNYDGEIKLQESSPFMKTVFVIQLPLVVENEGKNVA